MASAMTRLRPTKDQIAQLVGAYATHRPLIQRGLTAGFVLYVLSTTYNGLFGRTGPPASKRDKAKAKTNAEGGRTECGRGLYEDGEEDEALPADVLRELVVV